MANLMTTKLTMVPGRSWVPSFEPALVQLRRLRPTPAEADSVPSRGQGRFRS
jgi:hypothetical protein